VTKFFRTLALERADEKSRTVEASVSSEYPVTRGDFEEVLSHDPAAVDLTRMPLPVVTAHKAAEPAIGVFENARIEGGKLRGTVRFGMSARATELLQDVMAGVIRGMSIGYQVLKSRWEQDGKRMVATRWAPYEVSIVGVGADPTVGFGRSLNLIEGVTMSDIEITQDNEHLSRSQRRQQAQDANQKRVDEILALAEQHGKYLRQNDAAEFIRGMRSVDEFKDLIIRRQNDHHAKQTPINILNLSDREQRRYSFINLVKAAIDPAQFGAGAGYEREVSQGLARAYGRDPSGVFVPWTFSTRDFTVGSYGTAVVPTGVDGNLWTDFPRPLSAVEAIGAMVLPGLTGDLVIPRAATGATMGTLTEIGSAAETDLIPTNIKLSPKRVGAYVEASRQSILQAAMPTESLIKRDLMLSAAAQIDYLALNGNGTSPQPTGIRDTASIGTVVGGTNGAAPAWSHFVDLQSKCHDSNIGDVKPGYLLNSKTIGKGRQTQMGTSLGWIIGNDDLVAGKRFIMANHLPSNLTKGTSTTVCSAAVFSSDWNQAVLGYFGGADVVIDPYSKADQALVRITLNQFFDFGVRQPLAFSKVDDLITG